MRTFILFAITSPSSRVCEDHSCISQHPRCLRGRSRHAFEQHLARVGIETQLSPHLAAHVGYDEPETSLADYLKGDFYVLLSHRCSIFTMAFEHIGPAENLHFRFTFFDAEGVEPLHHIQ